MVFDLAGAVFFLIIEGAALAVVAAGGCPAKESDQACAISAITAGHAKKFTGKFMGVPYLFSSSNHHHALYPLLLLHP